MFKLGILLLLLGSFVITRPDVELIEHDLGTMLSGEKRACAIEFKEKINNVVSLCECLQAKAYKKEPASRDSLYVLEVEFDSTGYQGDTEEEVLILTSDGFLVRVRIKASVE